MSGLCEKCADKFCMGYRQDITECEDFELETNADKLRALPVEDLADAIFYELCAFQYKEDLLTYLRQPAKEGDT